jgi:RNA polymerase sigma-70 factor (ECF subfamily)
MSQDLAPALAADLDATFPDLVRAFQDRLFTFALRLLHSQQDAEESVQDAFVRAYNQLGQCQDPDKFVGWFFLILRNRCFAERRKSRSQAPIEAAAAVPAADRSEDGAESAERRRALQHALLELTPEQREVFVLKHVEGLSYGEIAERLSTSVPSLKMRMHRAYDRLRDQLRDHT